MKHCPSCKQDLPNEAFSKNAGRKDGLQPHCKLCKSRRHTNYYQGNKGRFVKYSRSRADRMRKSVDNLKAAPCTDCGRSYPPWVMDFDHLVSETKLFNVASVIRKGYSLDTVLEEISKCELVCANCHRQRTHDRRAPLE